MNWRNLKYDHEPKGDPYTEGENLKYGLGPLLAIAGLFASVVWLLWSVFV